MKKNQNMKKPRVHFVKWKTLMQDVNALYSYSCVLLWKAVKTSPTPRD